MSLIDRVYCGIPWKSCGRSRKGIDCVGLAHLWLSEQVGFAAPSPASDHEAVNKRPLNFKTAGWKRGDVVFFRYRSTGQLRHVAIYLGGNKYLHTLQGCQSRIDNGLELLSRLKMDAAGALGPEDADELCRALANTDLGWTTVILIAIALIAMGLSYALKPSLSNFSNRHGQYGPNALITQKNTEVPLPDLLGSVVVAGNQAYQQLPDHTASATASAQKWNQVIILASGPSELIDYQTSFQIKGISWQDGSWHTGSNFEGISPNPEQTKAAAVTGDIAGDTNVPSVSFYDGAYDIAVPVDVRAQYDRDFPVYGFSGCSYFVLRAFDSSKFTGMNFTLRVKCRQCRAFTSSGFTSTSVVAESVAGADGTKVRFKLAHYDLVAVTAVTVNGTSYTELSASNQAGNIYAVNKTKGYVEFMTAPAAAATVLVTYSYYPRTWTQNPANHIVYLLTEPSRGKGLDSSRIDWAAAVAFRDYCDTSITYNGPNGSVTGPRFTTNYAIDDRKPFQDHLQAMLDASNGQLFLSNGQFVIRSRVGGSSVFSFNSSNIVTDRNGMSSFRPVLLDRSAKPNRIKLLFSSEQSLNAEDEAIADDEDNQRSRALRVGNNGIVDENLKLPAVTDANQAQRLAEQALSEQVSSNFQYTWATSIQGLALQPGDVVDVTHDLIPGLTKLVRIETLEHSADDQLQITASEFVPQAYI